MRQQQKGFTVIELMIATSVVSIILLMASVVLVGIGNLYYKGITQSAIQGNARTITDDITQRIEFSSNPPKFLSNTLGTVHAVCIGDTRYTFMIGYQRDTNPDPSLHQSRHVLWRDTVANGNCPTPDIENKFLGVENDINTVALGTSGPSGQLYQGTNGAELIAPHSRLSNFSVVGLGPLNTGPYRITVDIAYGDDDLLCNPNITPNTCRDTSLSLSNAEFSASTLGLSCKGKAGDSFCATANLTTIAVQRLE